MRSYHSLLLAGLISLLPSLGFAADAAPALTEAQKAEVENVVRTLLTKKEPEIVIKAAQVVREQVETENEAKSKEVLDKSMDKVVNDPTSPVAGNPKGDVTIVEFFDYSCGYCKMAQETVAKLLGDDKNVKVIYKELPILGEGSVIASKAALASVAQGKYQKFHDTLMTNKGQFNETLVMKLAKDAGLDTDKLKKDMVDPKIEAIIKNNMDLAHSLGFQGTPTFIIAGKLYPGARPYDNMKSAIAEARANAPKK